MPTLPRFTAQTSEITGIAPEMQSSSRLSYATNISGNAVGLGAALYSGYQQIQQKRAKSAKKAQQDAKLELEMNKLNDNANLARFDMAKNEAVKSWETYKAENPNDLDKWQKQAQTIIESYKKNTKDFQFATPKGQIESKVKQEEFISEFSSNFGLDYTRNKVRVNDETLTQSAQEFMSFGNFDAANEKISQTTYTDAKKQEIIKNGQIEYIYNSTKQEIEIAKYSELDAVQSLVQKNKDALPDIKRGELDIMIEQKRTKLYNDSAAYYNSILNDYQDGKQPIIDENRLIPEHSKSLQSVAATPDGGLSLNDKIGKELQKEIDTISTSIPGSWSSTRSVKDIKDFNKIEKEIVDSALSRNSKLTLLNKLYGVAAFASSADTNGKYYLKAQLKRDLTPTEQSSINSLEKRFSTVIEKNGVVSPEESVKFRQEVYDEVIKYLKDAGSKANPENVDVLINIIYNQKYQQYAGNKYIKKITKQK